MRLLIRTWNLFHGRTLPESRRTHLEQMVALVCGGSPDVVCLQEVPVFALRSLTAWSGMQAVGAVAMPALGGRLGRLLTEREPGLLRSALAGQANATLVSGSLRLEGPPRTLPLNPSAFRRQQAARLGLPFATRLAWARNRRVAQVLRVRTGPASVALVNVHLTSLPDSRPAEAELLRAASYADGFARPGEPLVLAGDLNLTPASSRVLAGLTDWGFSPPRSGVDQILVRGLTVVRGPEAWPAERRRLGALLLSDHAPVEVEMIGA